MKNIKMWPLALMCLALSLSACGSSGSSSTEKVGEVETAAASGSEEAGTAAEENADTAGEVESEPLSEYHVGDILRSKDLEIVYVASGEYLEDNQYMQPDEGNKYIFLKFAVTNISDSDESISSYSFNCYADGYLADEYYGGDESLSATLSAGRSTEGSVYYEVPEDAEEIEVEYKPNLFLDETITFVYDGDADSGYVLEKNAIASADAVNVGETVSSDKLSVTYLDCFADTSDNMFINPEDGCHYVTCEFEFENISDSDVTVSYFSFDCYADGASCDGSYFRDDMISGTISPGRKAKGTVTFEVPDDASVVEVEYETNYWTSGRIVFNAAV